jgi:hypothetical protein
MLRVSLANRPALAELWLARLLIQYHASLRSADMGKFEGDTVGLPEAFVEIDYCTEL